MQIKIVAAALSIAFGGLHFGSVLAADLCAGKVTERDERVIPYMDKPDYMETYVDPAFGTKVTRISNAGSGSVVKTMYNTVQAWNADESLLLLYHTGESGAGHHLYNGQTFEYLSELDVVPSDLEEVFWDPTDPELLYYIQKYPVTDEFYEALVRYNVRTEGKEVIADLGSYCGHPAESGGSARTGSDVQALRGRLLGVRCNNNGFQNVAEDQTFYVNVDTGEISQSITIAPSIPYRDNPFSYWEDAALMVAPSGNRVFLQSSVLDLELNVLRNLDINYTTTQDSEGQYVVPNPEHQTVGILPNGNDGLFTVMFDAPENGCDNDANDGVGSLITHDFETGECNVIIGQSKGWDYPKSGTHISALSSQPGWAVTSSIAYGSFEYFDNELPAPVLTSELTLTYVDPEEPVTCRLAHARTYAKDAENTEGYRFGYFGEPHPVISPSGTRILFSSDWYDSGSVDTYVINLEDENNSSVITTVNTQYTRGDQLVFNFNIPAGGSGLDKVVLAKPEAEDADYIAWLYTNGTQFQVSDGPLEGQLIFESSGLELGLYEARLYFDDSTDLEATVSFSIVEEETETIMQFSIEKSVVAQGESVKIDFSGLPGNLSDWIGIVPENPVGGYSADESIFLWKYTNGSNALLSEAPNEGFVEFPTDRLPPGSYQARLYFDGGYSAVSQADFTVTLQPGSIATTKPNYSVGEEIEVEFSNVTQDGLNWISITKADASETDILSWSYTNGRKIPSSVGPSEGRLGFHGDQFEAGHYEVRLYYANSFDRVATASFIISEIRLESLPVISVSEGPQVASSRSVGIINDWFSAINASLSNLAGLDPMNSL